MAGMGYSASASNKVSSSSANKGMFGTVNFGGLNFAPLDSIPGAVFGGGGGTQSRTMMYVLGAGILVAGAVAVIALKRKR